MEAMADSWSLSSNKEVVLNSGCSSSAAFKADLSPMVVVVIGDDLVMVDEATTYPIGANSICNHSTAVEQACTSSAGIDQRFVAPMMGNITFLLILNTDL